MRFAPRYTDYQNFGDFFLKHRDTVTQRNSVKDFKPLSEREIFLSQQVVNISFCIHKSLGPGLLESVYSKCFIYELEKRRIPFIYQQPVSIMYDHELLLENGLRLDLLIDDLIVVEIKAQENYHPVWKAQILSYLKLTEKRLGYIINFHTELIKNGITRLIN
jgi:GxxExxY protein